MKNTLIALSLTCTMFSAGAWAEDAPVKISPEKLEQLKRMVPLTKAKVGIFVESGQLRSNQADVVLRYLDANGQLNIPNELIGEEVVVRQAVPSAPRAVVTAPGPVNAAPTPVVRQSSPPMGSLRYSNGAIDVMSWIRADDASPTESISAELQRQFVNDIRAYRYASSSDRAAILRSLGTMGAPANTLVAAEYTDPIDMDIKCNLWAAVANSNNPKAAGYIASTHNAIMQTSRPILIPYDKDAGGLIVRRRIGADEPRQKWFESRELRGRIVDLEESISYCAGIRAVTYLMDVYASRYETDFAPMRDESRDRERMVRACGGPDKKNFKDSDPRTWTSNLLPQERAMIAERLVPQLNAIDNDTRKIARDGLLVALGVADKDLKKRLEKAHDDMPSFMNWWAKRREELLAGN